MTDLRIPTSIGEVTPAWLTQALRSTGALGGVSVTSCSAEEISPGTGFMNQLFRLALEFDAEPADLPRTVMVKLPSTDPGLRTIFDSLGSNQREVRYYRDLAPGGLLTTPRLYYGATDAESGDSVQLLEDLSFARQGDSLAGCSMDDARLVINEMARFHASWWGRCDLDGMDWMPSKASEAGAYGKLYGEAWVSLIAKTGDRMPGRLRGIGDVLSGEVSRVKAMLSEPPVTVAHGDFRLDNCFFPEADGSPALVVFDWEFCVRGRGAFDAATFIAESLPTEQRRSEEMGLLRLYHEALIENGVSDYPFEACLRDYRVSFLDILVFWIVTGGYCDYSSDRASEYLRNTLARYDAAIADLDCMDLLAS